MLRDDQQNVAWTVQVLERVEALGLYKRMPDLFDSLLQAVKQNMPAGAMPFVRHDAKGVETIALDFPLRVQMALSAKVQFTYAAGHLLRGHLTEIFGHARRAIEGAGIAYRSRVEPDIADVYMATDRRQLIRRTATATILPTTDPLTADLNADIDFASQQIHNNLTSLVNRLRQSFTVTDGQWRYRVELTYHELDHNDEAAFLRYAIWLLSTAGRVALLLAASFDLPHSPWHQAHNEFRGEVERLRTRFGP